MPAGQETEVIGFQFDQVKDGHPGLEEYHNEENAEESERS
jgi:hypothetical protein